MTSLQEVTVRRSPRLPARADVQGLRALAVGLVVLDHAGVPFLAGGFVGVDVFFVVSGYLISSLLLREMTTTGRVRIGEFYARRARRILPAATVVLVAVTAFATLRLPLGRAAQVGGDVVWSAFFVGNVRFARQGTDYFAEDSPASPVQHFWSLAVEEQFYLVWPLALALTALLAWRLARRGGAEDLPDGRAAAAAGALPAVTVAVALAWVGSLAWSVHLTALEPTAAYFSTPARAWELATGALLALGAARLALLPRGLRRVLAGAGLGAVLVAAFAYGPGTAFPGWQAGLPVLGTAAVLAAGADGEALGAARLLTSRPMTWLGDISYSLYLWHWPVLVLGARYAEAYVGPGATGTAVLVLVALALSVASYHLVEAPFRRPRPWWGTTPRALVLWPVGLALVVGSVGLGAVQRDRVGDARAAEAAGFDLDSVPPDLRTPRNGDPVHDALAESLDRAVVGGPIPFPVRNDLENLDADRPDYPARCFAERTQESSDLCPLGDTDAGTTVVLLGDSHAQMWLSALDAVGQEAGFEVLPLIKFGCPPADLRLRELDVAGDPEFTACYAWRDWALEQVRVLEPDTVVMSSRAPPPGLVLPAGTTREQQWTDAVAERAAELDALADRVVVGGDVSYLRRDPAVCVGAAANDMGDCTVPVDPESRTFIGATRQAAETAGVDFADLNQLVCLDGLCPMVVDRTVTYHDGQHVGALWAEQVGSELAGLLGLVPDRRPPGA